MAFYNHAPSSAYAQKKAKATTSELVVVEEQKNDNKGINE